MTAAGKAPSKLILLGEHSVVYGQPAIAVPLRRPSAEALAHKTSSGSPAVLCLRDFDLDWSPGEDDSAPEIRPFAELLKALRARHSEIPEKGWKLEVRSDIPIGCGLGSGAAVSVAAVGALCACHGLGCGRRAASELAYEAEKVHHGTPSGVDNTVIAMGRPVLFKKGSEPELVDPPRAPVHLVVGYTGRRHKTSEVVSDVAKAREADAPKYDAIFSEMGRIARDGLSAFRLGRFPDLGRLMDCNQGLLELIGVSSPELKKLITAARAAGALGAKLSGAGRGGCMAALAADGESARRIRGALEAAGASKAFTTGILRGEECGASSA